MSTDLTSVQALLERHQSKLNCLSMVESWNADASEMVHTLVNSLVLKCGNYGARMLVDALHGHYGVEVASDTWVRLARGVEIAHDPQGSGEPVFASFGAVCMFTGALGMLKAVVKAGAPVVVPEEMRPRVGIRVA